MKSLPEDYIDGKLIVDGVKMANDTFKGVGYCLGFHLIGWFLEEDSCEVRYGRCNASDAECSACCHPAFSGYYIVSLIIETLIKNFMPAAAGNLITCFIRDVLCGLFAFPFFMKALTGPRSHTDWQELHLRSRSKSTADGRPLLIMPRVFRVRLYVLVQSLSVSQDLNTLIINFSNFS